MSSVMHEVDLKEQKNRSTPWIRQELIRFPGIIVGVLIFAFGVNMFLRPLHLYSGGFMGFSQLCNTLLHDYLGVKWKLDISGIVYYLLNIPALIIAYRTMQKRFVFKTIINVTLITVVMTMIPIPSAPILEEKIANCLVAGIMAGVGIGLMLRMGSCDGGMDLVGMILIKNKGHFSVGQVNIFANIILYGIFLFLFDVPTVIYSLIYSVINSTACDRVHTQNINVQALIVTKLPDISPLEIEIMGQMNRGLTRWNACGSYTGEEENILMAVISKYEITQLKSIVHQIDPKAFVMIDEGVAVDGHFVKKIT